MDSLDATQVLLGCAAVSWGTTGALLCRGGPSAHRGLGAGLLAGALLLALDTLGAGAAPLPLAAWVLLSVGVFGRLLPGARGAAPVAVAAVAALLAHWAHVVQPSQPELLWPVAWRPLDLATGVALAWCAARGAGGAARWLFAVVAVGLVAAAFAGPLAGAAGAGAAMLAPLGLLVPAVRSRPHHAASAAATACMVTLTLALRDAVFLGAPLGIAEPMLVLAAAFVAFGVWLQHAQTTTAMPVSPVSPVSPPTDDAVVDSAARTLASIDAIHDLRRPLTNLLAAAELADANGSAEQRATLLVQLRAHGRQLAESMADIEELAGLLLREVDLADDAFDLHGLLEQCVDEVAREAAQREVPVRYAQGQALPRWTRGDAARLRQLIGRVLQLATNGCTLGAVDVSADAREGELAVVVRNLRAAPDESGELGRTFADALAQALGGQLSVSPCGNGGAEYRLSLPHRAPESWDIEPAADADTDTDTDTNTDTDTAAGTAGPTTSVGATAG